MAALRFLLTVSLVLACGVRARADQLTLIDETYTHAAMNTSDSHYRVAPEAGAPKDWTKPVNYAGGSVHVLLQVKSKPSDVATRFQVCFEKGSSAACAVQSPTYTKPTTLEWDDPVSNFWNGSAMNWANGIDKVALILKDNNNGKPQGDPKFVPTDLHVVVTLVSAGSKYSAATTDAGSADAGSADAGKPDAGKPDAGKPDVGSDAGALESDAGDTPTAVDAGSTLDAALTPSVDAARPDARVTTDAAMASNDDPVSEQPGAKSDGCAVGGSARDGWFALVMAIALARRRRRS